MVDTDFELEALYAGVARYLANRVLTIFQSEESLAERWKLWTLSDQPLDRTSNWNHILRAEFQEAWAMHGPIVVAPHTAYDVECVMKHLVEFLDFNLFSQVYLNLQQTGVIRYRLDLVEKKLAEIEGKWKGKTASPLEAKKAIKNPANAEESDFNRDFSTLKTLKQLQKFGAALSVSFRVSPMGSTPALIDSDNLSSLGIGSDEFLQVPHSWHVAHIYWDQPLTMLEPWEGGKFKCGYTKYLFTSKSGGDILNSSLYSRFLMTKAYQALEGSTVFVPRLNSILVVTQTPPDKILELLGAMDPGIGVTLGARSPRLDETPAQ